MTGPRSFSFFALLLLALPGPLAHAQKEICEGFLRPQRGPERQDFPAPKRPGWWPIGSPSIENHIIPGVRGREQCFGTCYFFAAHVVAEHAALLAGDLPAGAYVLNLPALLQLARARVEAGEGEEGFARLVSRGMLEGFVEARRRSARYLTAAALREVGGPRMVQAAEASVVQEIVAAEKRSGLGELLSEAGVARLQARLNELLSRRAGRPITLRALPPRELRLAFYGKLRERSIFNTLFENTPREGLFAIAGPASRLDLDLLAHAGYDELGVAAPPPLPSPAWKWELGYQRVPSFGPVWARARASLARGQPVMISLDRSYWSTSHDHAVALTGVRRDRRTGATLGFHYVNSSGPERGFLKIEDAETYFGFLAVPEGYAGP